MPEAEYLPPVARLLAAGDPHAESKWPDYPETYGLAAKDIPELIRLAVDEKLAQAAPGSELAWAPRHAWRALGQLQAQEAIQPLLGILRWIDDFENDAVEDELPTIFAMIGPAAIKPLAAYLAKGKHAMWARLAAADALEKIADEHPETCNACSEGITRALEPFASNDETFNGFLISHLAEMGAVEAAPLVERVFAADMVDLTVNGDWEDFQVEVGLLSERLTPERFSDWGLEPATTLADEGQKTGKEDKDKKGKKKHKLKKQLRKKDGKKK